MIDVSKMLIDVMKKKIFADTDLINKSARNVLAEIKTKNKDIKEEITSQLQQKMLIKMLNDRNKSLEFYVKGNRQDLIEKEQSDIFVIKALLLEVEKDLPKQLTKEEIVKEINSIIIANPGNINISVIMKEFKDIPADKALVSKLAKEILSLYMA